MIELKPGNGGYGLEAYDTETGKYADSVSVSFKDENGNSYDNLKNFKDFLKVIGGQQMVDLYDEDEEFRKMIHDYQGDDGFWQVWEKMLKNEVDKINRREELAKQGEILYETSMDVANNAHNFFTREVINDIINQPNYDCNCLNYAKDGSASVFSANLIAEKFREARYGSERMIPISQKEFEQKCGPYINHFAFKGVTEDEKYVEAKERIEEINKNGYYVPIYRGIGRYKDEKSTKIAITSFFKKDFNPSESVAFTGSGYYDSVIYMSVSDNYVSNYSSNHFLKSCVKFDDLKVADLRTKRIGTTEMENFMDNDYKIFIKNLETKMINDGYDSTQIKDFCEKVEKQCSKNKYNNKPNNLGFVTMLFGYDAILGTAGQLDILNMKKVYALDEGWGL